MDKLPIPVSELLAAIEIEESRRARLSSANANKPSKGQRPARTQRSRGSTNKNKPSKGQIPAWPRRSRGSTHENGRHHGSGLVASPITDFTPFFPPSSPDDKLRTAKAFNDLRDAVRSVIDSAFDREAERSSSTNRNRPMTRRESREHIISENLLAKCPFIYDERPSHPTGPRPFAPNRRPSPSENSAVRDWRRQAEHQVKTRIADFACHDARSPYGLYAIVNLVSLVQVMAWFCNIASRVTGFSYLVSMLLRSFHKDGIRSEHQMLQIAELRNAVLKLAEPHAQIQALRVSRSWHDSALLAIRDFAASSSTPSCEPIEYNQQVDERVAVPMQPSPEELVQFERHLRCNPARAQLGYHPAKFVFAKDLHPFLRRLLIPYENYLLPTVSSMFYYDPLYNSTRTDRWHDLSQLSISPYLEALLTADDQIKHRLGRWEITLRPSSSLKTLVFNDDFATKVVLNNIGSLQVTNPPCRALGLYHDDPGGSVAESTRLLVRVKNDNGVSIAEFAHALQYAAPTTHEAWMANANHLVNKIRRSPRSHDIWHIPGAPTIRVHLDNVSMPESGDPVSYGLHPNRYAQMKAEPDRRSREMAWISEDLLEPTGAIVDRDPIDWDEWGDVLKLME